MRAYHALPLILLFSCTEAPSPTQPAVIEEASVASAVVSQGSRFGALGIADVVLPPGFVAEVFLEYPAGEDFSFGPEGDLWISGEGPGQVSRVSLDRSSLRARGSQVAIVGLGESFGVIFDRTGNLYVPTFSVGTVEHINANLLAGPYPVDAAGIPSLVTGLDHPDDGAFAPPGSPFGPNLFVGMIGAPFGVLEIDPISGNTVAHHAFGGEHIEGIIFSDDGLTAFAHSPGAGTVFRWDYGTAPRPLAGGLRFPDAVVLGPGNEFGSNLFAADLHWGEVYAIDASSGNVTPFADLSGVLEGIEDIEFDDNGFMYVLGWGASAAVVRIAPSSDVAIDIDPGSEANTIDLGGAPNVSVAFLGGGSVDVATIDPGTATFFGVGPESWSLVDTNGDGAEDLVLSFVVADLQSLSTTARARAIAYTYARKAVVGYDAVTVTGASRAVMEGAQIHIYHWRGLPRNPGGLWGGGVEGLIREADAAYADGWIEDVWEAGAVVGSVTTILPSGEERLADRYQPEACCAEYAMDFLKWGWFYDGPPHPDAPPAGNWVSVLKGGSGQELDRYSIDLRPEWIDLADEELVVLAPTPEAIIDDQTPTFRWLKHSRVETIRTQSVHISGPMHLPPSERMEIPGPNIVGSSADELEWTYPDGLGPEWPAELPYGRYAVEIGQGFSPPGEGGHEVNVNVWRFFQLIISDGRPMIEAPNLGIQYGYDPEGAYRFYGLGGGAEVIGDFAGVGTSDVEVTVAGSQQATIREVFVEHRGGSRYKLRFHALFEEDQPPLGQYEFRVRDAGGVFTRTIQAGILDEVPTAAPRLTHPQSGSLVYEATPDFVWESFDDLDHISPPGHYAITLDGMTAFVPPDRESVPFENEYWITQPPPLEPGAHRIEINTVHYLTDVLHLVPHRATTFAVLPETLIINPQDQHLSAACPIPANYIVQDEVALRVAMELVQPGEVIGIDGMIEIGPEEPSVGLYVRTDDVTLTCASLGSGLTLAPEEPVDLMVYVESQGVSIKHLKLDGSNVTQYTVVAQNRGDGVARSSNLTIADSEIVCAPSACVFLIGAAGSVLENNDFVLDGASAAVWVQGSGPRGPDGMSSRPTDGTRVIGNRIRSIRAGSPATRGIRVRDGEGLVVMDNDFSGPISNPIYVSNIRNSVIEKNRIPEPTTFGLYIAGNLTNDRTVGTLIKNNHFTDAGIAGAYMDAACGNTFIGNNLRGSPRDGGLILDTRTGANAVNGVGKSVIDNGVFDCDGDGTIDSNVVAGSGTPRRGVRLGEMISSAIQAANEVVGDEIR